MSRHRNIKDLASERFDQDQEEEEEWEDDSYSSEYIYRRDDSAAGGGQQQEYYDEEYDEDEGYYDDDVPAKKAPAKPAAKPTAQQPQQKKGGQATQAKTPVKPAATKEQKKSGTVDAKSAGSKSPVKAAPTHVHVGASPAPAAPAAAGVPPIEVPSHDSKTRSLPSSSPVASPTATAVIAAATTAAKRAKERAALLAAEDKKDAKKLEQINMVVIGHVDAGKSTLMGHLLYLTGRVSQKLIHKYERESREMGKASFAFAWVLDEHEEERSRGITVDVAVNYFETSGRRVTLLDAPGHRDFIPNMISGTAQADVAILVVPASTGEFESGFSEDGQTREHAILARSLGVSQLLVAVNKLDAADWSRTRYQEILDRLLPFLRQAGFKDKQVRTVPVSGFTGENIVTRKEAKLSAWYTGPTLLEMIDTFDPPSRSDDAPVRLTVTDVYRSQTMGQVVAGKIEAGAMMARDPLLILPINQTCSVKALESRGEPVNVARAGDQVEIGLRDLANPDALAVGQVLCDPQRPLPVACKFRAQIITLNLKLPLLAGTEVMLFTQSHSVEACLTKLKSTLDKTTGAVTKKKPRALGKHMGAIVVIETRYPLCIDLYSNSKSYGRVALRRGDDTVAVGIILKIVR